MGYVAYNIYLIELRHMFKGNNDIRKETELIYGVYDYLFMSEVIYNTTNKSHKYYRDMSPSVNQSGGAEYSYNFWLYIDQSKLSKLRSEGNANKKDIVLFYKGNKNLYYSDSNYNCQYKNADNFINIVTKNPLVRINHDGTCLAVDYNNILTSDSYQNNSIYKQCKFQTLDNKWESKNKNMLGIYDITFNNKWFMVTIVIKEVADNNNILSKNRAICRMYINGMLIFENKAETIYNQEIHSATIKHNKSPFYINPSFSYPINKTFSSTQDMRTKYKNLAPYLDLNHTELTIGNDEDARLLMGVLRIADLKYYNYAINQEKINSIYREGFYKEILTTITLENRQKQYVLSQYELDNNVIKEL